MKKYLALVLGTLFVLGFAAPSFAIHASIPAETAPVVSPLGIHTQLGGEIRVRGWYSDNIGIAVDPDGPPPPRIDKAATGDPYATGSMGWYDQRVRLFVNSRIGANVSGRILLETAGENYRWGAANTFARGGGVWATAGTDIDLVEAWIAYTGKGLLGVPSGIRLGQMPLVVGEGLFFDHRRRGSSAILLWAEPVKGTGINFAIATLGEGAQLDRTDDLDLYSLMLTHRLDKDNTIGANLSLIKSSDIGGGPGALGLAGALYSMPVGGPLPTPLLNYADAKLNLWNLGLSARGRVSDIGYRAALDFQFGEVDNIAVAGFPHTSVDFRGYGLILGADYRIDPVTLRANFVYGSGDDTPEDRKAKTFQAFVGNVIDPNLPTVVYGWRVTSAADGLGTGIANTTAFNIGITTDPIRDLRVHLDYYILRASERLSAVPHTFGHDKDIGSELTLRATYRIARNLTYAINAGVLFAGDFYRDTATFGAVAEPKNAKVFQHQIVFAF